MNDIARHRIIVPLDVPSAAEALEIVRLLKGRVGMFKVGLQLFCAEGPDIVRRIADAGEKVFLDLKLHDIPNTVHRAVEAIVPLRASMIDVHLGGGERMLRAAVAALQGAGAPARARLLGITVLTSLGEEDLAAAGVTRSVQEQVVALARLGRKTGLDGVVASPWEIAAIKEACPSPFLVVAPGVRPAGSAWGDQRRVMTPGEAVAAGADYIVVGRPILEAPDPVAASDAIAREISS